MSNPHTRGASGLFTVVTRPLANYHQQVFTGKGKIGKEAGQTACISGFMNTQAFTNAFPFRLLFMSLDERATTSDSSLLHRDVKVIITHSRSPRWFPG